MKIVNKKQDIDFINAKLSLVYAKLNFSCAKLNLFLRNKLVNGIVSI